MEALTGMDRMLGGIAAAILVGGLLILVSGTWSVRDK